MNIDENEKKSEIGADLRSKSRQDHDCDGENAEKSVGERINSSQAQASCLTTDGATSDEMKGDEVLDKQVDSKGENSANVSLKDLNLKVVAKTSDQQDGQQDNQKVDHKTPKTPTNLQAINPKTEKPKQSNPQDPKPEQKSANSNHSIKSTISPKVQIPAVTQSSSKLETPSSTSIKSSGTSPKTVLPPPKTSSLPSLPTVAVSTHQNSGTTTRVAPLGKSRPTHTALAKPSVVPKNDDPDNAFSQNENQSEVETKEAKRPPFGRTAQSPSIKTSENESGEVAVDQKNNHLAEKSKNQSVSQSVGHPPTASQSKTNLESDATDRIESEQVRSPSIPSSSGSALDSLSRKVSSTLRSRSGGTNLGKRLFSRTATSSVLESSTQDQFDLLGEVPSSTDEIDAFANAIDTDVSISEEASAMGLYEAEVDDTPFEPQKIKFRQEEKVITTTGQRIDSDDYLNQASARKDKDFFGGEDFLDEKTEVSEYAFIPESGDRASRHTLGTLRGVSSICMGKTFTIKDAKVTIGRSFESTFVVNDASLSRTHAELMFYPDGTAVIRDLNSANGTFVNGIQVSVADLRETDLLKLGEALFHFEPEQRIAHGRTRRALGPNGEPVFIDRTTKKFFDPTRIILAVTIISTILLGAFLTVMFLNIQEEKQIRQRREEASRRYIEGVNAMQTRNWDLAEKHFLRVRETDKEKEYEQLNNQFKRIEKERNYGSLLDKALSAKEAGNLKEAKGFAEKIPKDSIYFTDASELLMSID